jgi:hypothetical protein
MKRQSPIFLTAFTLTAVVVAPLVYLGRPLWGLAAGAAGVLVHWLFSRNGADDGEVADSSYFGFLLTLVFLAVGLYKLGAPPPPTAVGTAAPDNTRVVLGFLEDLAAGLALTIVGLLVRQARTLGAAGAAAPARETSLLAAQIELTRNLEALIEMWRQRPEQQVLQELHESRSIARGAAEQLERSVAAAGERMLHAVGRLEEATATAAQTMTRAASGIGDSLSQTSQRLDAEVSQLTHGLGESLARATQRIEAGVTEVLSVIERQRVESADALAAAQAAATEMRASADAHLHEQLELWRATLERTQTALDEAHRNLDGEYRRGLEGFAASGAAFAQLTAQTVERVAALPDPAERLGGLWDGVRQLESSLTAAISGSVQELATLRERSEQLSESLARLGGSAGAAADSLGAGGDRLAETLHRELRQMNGVIDEYVSLLESTTSSLPVRA